MRPLSSASVPFLNTLHGVGEEKQCNELFCHDEMVNFSPAVKWTTSRGCAGGYSMGRSQNGSFHLTSDRTFRNLWHYGKHLFAPVCQF